MPVVRRTKGMVLNDKDVTPADGAPGVNNALIGEEYANTVYQESTGSVSLLGADGAVHTYPGLLGGVVHNLIPFSQVLATSTAAGTVKVGITFD